MKVLLLLGFVVLAIVPASAGDVGNVPPPWPAWHRGAPLDLTARTHSRAVRVSDACWRTCATNCAWRFHVCANAYRLNDCRAETDACDLACLKTCRAYGGPLLDITDSGP